MVETKSFANASFLQLVHFDFLSAKRTQGATRDRTAGRIADPVCALPFLNANPISSKARSP